MSLIALSDVGKGFGPQTVLAAVSLRVARGEKIGIVGKNGGGKSTLLKLILGLETPDRGSVKVARGIRIGYLSQIAALDGSRTVREEAESALVALADAEERLRMAERQLAEHPDDEDLLDAYGAARDLFDFAGGDGARDSLYASLVAMGLPEADWDKPVSVLSGGEKTRLSMAKLLATAPDVLALDEPTNHLDIRAVEWLEAFLQRFPGAILVVSHDRRLLESVASTVWEVDAEGVVATSGGYVAYREKRAATRARQLDEYQRQQAEIARTEEFIRRNKAGQNTRIAMGRQKRLDRLERLERPPDEPEAMKARPASSGRSGQDVVVAERVSKRYGDKVLLDAATFTLRRGERIGIVGPNGVGKTTFIEMVLGEESPDSGFLRCGHGVTVAQHKQEQDDFEPDETVLEAFYERAGMSVAEARSHLARFLFTGDDVFKPVSALSGGERAKLSMALMVLTPANLLILDEPTNHLDVYSCEALADALARYSGTLLLVSHDRALLDAVTTKTLALEGEGRFTLVDGNYAAWRSRVPEAAPADGRRRQVALPPTPVATSAHRLSKERQRVQRRVAALEAEITALEGEIVQVEARLAAPGSADESITLAAEHTRLTNALAAKLTEWEEAAALAETLTG
jgi:ATP-binding cassette subfamily F protein 3